MNEDQKLERLAIILFGTILVLTGMISGVIFFFA
jgi:hypothetical protein|tara:strand:+ start:2432 stop:2533 length:102 start_codon:yes stop_codon:yes gene_type:complete